MALKQHSFLVRSSYVVSWFIIVRYLYCFTTTFFQVPKIGILNNKKYVVYCYVLTTYGKTIQLLCAFGPHFWITFLSCLCIKSQNNVTATFLFALLLERNFIFFFILFCKFTHWFQWFCFFMTSDYV